MIKNKFKQIDFFIYTFTIEKVDFFPFIHVLNVFIHIISDLSNPPSHCIEIFTVNMLGNPTNNLSYSLICQLHQRVKRNSTNLPSHRWKVNIYVL